MKVKITSSGHRRADVVIGDQQAKHVRSLHLEMAVDSLTTLTLEHNADEVQFEGEAQVIAVINGQRYRLIEDQKGVGGSKSLGAPRLRPRAHLRANFFRVLKFFRIWREPYGD